MVDVTGLPKLNDADREEAEIYVWVDGAPTTDNNLPLKEIMGRTLGLNAQAGTSYTLALSDMGKLVSMNNAAANTLTVPLNSAVAFPIGAKIDVGQYGAGVTTIAAEVGVTIRNADGLAIALRYGGATLVKIGTNEWWAFGRLSA